VLNKTGSPMVSKPLTYAVVGLVLLALVVWSYFSTIIDTVERWTTDSQYSHCWLVPFVSAYLLYHRRKLIPTEGFTPRWWGLGVVLAGVLARAAAIAFYLPWLDSGSLVIVIAGLICTVGGRAGLLWAWPAALYLVFMMPLPFRLQNALGGTLQTIATYMSTYLLQTVGVPAVSEGHVIALSQARIGVEEACNGLSMLVTFFALAVLFALVIRRGWAYKVAFVVAAAPIAVLANVLRITATGLLYEANQNGLARIVFHDIAGWLMMPLGAAMLLAVMLYIDRIVKVPATARAKS
jgi:exosortase